MRDPKSMFDVLPQMLLPPAPPFPIPAGQYDRDGNFTLNEPFDKYDPKNGDAHEFYSRGQMVAHLNRFLGGMPHVADNQELNEVLTRLAAIAVESGSMELLDICESLIKHRDEVYGAPYRKEDGEWTPVELCKDQE